MNKKWLRSHYRRHPRAVQRIVTNEHLLRNESVLREAIRRMPQAYILWSKLAVLLKERGRGPEARRVWHRAASRFPAMANPFFLRAHWAMQDRKFNEAEKYLRLCLIRDRGYFGDTARFWRAEALYRLGRFPAALRELTCVPNDYEEMWFLEHEKWSKADLLAKIAAQRRE